MYIYKNEKEMNVNMDEKNSSNINIITSFEIISKFRKFWNSIITGIGSS